MYHGFYQREHLVLKPPYKSHKLTDILWAHTGAIGCIGKSLISETEDLNQEPLPTPEHELVGNDPTGDLNTRCNRPLNPCPHAQLQASVTALCLIRAWYVRTLLSNLLLLQHLIPCLRLTVDQVPNVRCTSVLIIQVFLIIRLLLIMHDLLIIQVLLIIRVFLIIRLLLRPTHQEN